MNIQNWDEHTWHFSRERAIVGRDASLQWTVGGLGSRLSKVNQEVALAGQGAKAQVNGVMFTTGRQHLAYFTRQDHMAPHTTSDLLYKAGLKDKSRIVWKGMIRVEKDAQRTDAYQKNDNLVLSHSARADSIPGLEIEANDVRCTHGATAGRVDEEMIFYAQARAIPKETMIRLIVEGFFANVYDPNHDRSGSRSGYFDRRSRTSSLDFQPRFSTESFHMGEPYGSSGSPGVGRAGSPDHFEEIPRSASSRAVKICCSTARGHIPGSHD